MAQIAPSMLSADFLHLEEDVKFVNGHADIFHLDIMDGIFVPNISYGFPVVEAIASRAQKPMDAHLMILHPEKYIERFAKAGVRMLSFHFETGGDTAGILDRIKALGMCPGLAINTDILVENIYPYLEKCGFVVIMSVFAGFGGQKFIEDSYGRIEILKKEIVSRGLDCKIEVDGGVSPSNSSALIEAGADILVAGSAVFRASDPADAVRRMRSL